jgi:adenylyltransferase/sulfurtransferase
VNGSTDPFYRYSRQLLVPQIGRAGQEKIGAARVGLVGCGALGSVIANHLVRAGVGFLRIADRDYPEIHNLHRQMLFTEADVAAGTPKAEAAAAHLREINSSVTVEPAVMNAYAVTTGTPWVYGGVIGTSGMSMTIVPGDGPCLRCLVPELPSSEQTPTADVAGVLGTIVAVIGSVEATEVLKLIVDPSACNRELLVVDLWDLVFEKLEVRRDVDCPCCAP